MSIQSSINRAAGAVSGAIIASEIKKTYENQNKDREAAIAEEKKRKDKYVDRGHAAWAEMLDDTKQNDPVAYNNLLKHQKKAMKIVDDYIVASEFQRGSFNAKIDELKSKGLTQEAKELDDRGHIQAQQTYNAFREKLEKLKGVKKTNGKQQK